MDSQITFTGFEPPEYHEREFLDAIEPNLRAAVEDMGGDGQLMKIAVTSSYTAVTVGNLTAFRLRIRGKQRYFLIPLTLIDLIPKDVPTKNSSADGKYRRVLITDEHQLDHYTSFLTKMVGETVNRYPKEWDCCSRYLECSDAKTCTHPDKAFALSCGYRKILGSGRIFYGENRNV